MNFNPPETRDAINDTLYLCVGSVPTYTKTNEKGSHVFNLDVPGMFVKIRGPRSIQIGKTLYRSVTDAQEAIMKRFL